MFYRLKVAGYVPGRCRLRRPVGNVLDVQVGLRGNEFQTALGEPTIFHVVHTIWLEVLAEGGVTAGKVTVLQARDVQEECVIPQGGVQVEQRVGLVVDRTEGGRMCDHLHTEGALIGGDRGEHLRTAVHLTKSGEEAVTAEGNHFGLFIPAEAEGTLKVDGLVRLPGEGTRGVRDDALGVIRVSGSSGVTIGRTSFPQTQPVETAAGGAGDVRRGDNRFRLLTEDEGILHVPRVVHRGFFGLVGVNTAGVEPGRRLRSGTGDLPVRGEDAGVVRHRDWSVVDFQSRQRSR